MIQITIKIVDVFILEYFSTLHFTCTYAQDDISEKPIRTAELVLFLVECARERVLFVLDRLRMSLLEKLERRRRAIIHTNN